MARLLLYVFVQYLMVLNIHCGYELLLTIHSFDNPRGLCADENCNAGLLCCELSSCSSTCDYAFSFCQRPANSSVSFNRRTIQGNCPSFFTLPRQTAWDGDFTDSVFGVSNPVAFSGDQWPVNGIQIFMEIIDIDTDSSDELIDRFALNITLSAGTTTGRQTHSGIFGLAEIDVTASVACAENFIGPNCDVYSLNMPTSDPEISKQRPDSLPRRNGSTSSSIVIQLIMGFSFLLVNIITSIIIFLYMKKKMINYVRQCPETDNMSYTEDITTSGELNNVQSGTPESDSSHKGPQYVNVDHNCITRAFADNLVEEPTCSLNVSYDVKRERFCCEPCPAYGTN